MVSGGGNLAVEGARVAAGLTSLAVALASPLSPPLFPLLGRGFSPDPLALALAAPAAVEVALISAASARCNAEGRWRELAAARALNGILSGEDCFVAAAGWPARVLLRFSFGLLSARPF